MKQGNTNIRQRFTAILENPGMKSDSAYISIPFDVEKIYGTKGQVKVKAWFDNHPYRGVIANMGTGSHILIVRKDIRASIGKKVGDKILVELEQDTEERLVEIPQVLREAFKDEPEAETFFNTLSYTNKKEFANWITSAKKAETLERRIHETIAKLKAGKKNPSQK